MNRKLILGFAVISVLCGALQFRAVAEEPSAIDKATNRHILNEYGPCSSVAESKIALQKAMKTLVEQGGGVLVIPNDAPKDFIPQNSSQGKYKDPGVTIIDYRGGLERVYVPSLGTSCSDAFHGGGCKITERHLAQTLPWSGTYATEKYMSHYFGGASSILLKTTQNAEAGKNTRIHVPSLRGFFIGQVLDIRNNGQREWIAVKELGKDEKGTYFVADLKEAFPEQSTLYNKNVVNSLTIDDISNCDNQSTSLIVNREVYGTGDSFNVQSNLKYQGNIMSAEGDEGAVVYAAEIVQDLQIFRGKVESWNRETRELVYQPGAVWSNKIGTSRPLVNMNEKKWVTSGKVMITPPGIRYLREDDPNWNWTAGIVVGSADCGWDKSLVGRWFTVNDPSEYYSAKENLGPLGQLSAPVHLWWCITGIEKRADGRFNLYVEATKWSTSLRSSPRLFKSSNLSSSDSVRKELDYIIAPGAWVSDARDGISGFMPGTAGIASDSEPRKLLLAPSGAEGTRFDFEKDDPVIQPPGSNVYAPTGFRVRHFNMFPPMPQMGNSSYAATNLGLTQVSAALSVGGNNSGTLEESIKGQKDGRTPFESAVSVFAGTSNTFVVRGPVGNAVFDFWQEDGNVKRFQWRLPQNGRAYFQVNPDNADFVFQGGNLKLSSKGTVGQSGISATDKPARNLRGINVSVKAESKTAEIKFQNAETDTEYSIVVQPNWNTNDWTAEKRVDGFKVEFSEQAPKNAKIDWQLIR